MDPRLLIALTWACATVLSTWISRTPPAIIVSEIIHSELANPWFQTSQFLERVDVYPPDGGFAGPPTIINTCSLFPIEQTAFSPVCPIPQLPSILVVHDLPLKPLVEPIIEVEEVVAPNVTDNNSLTVVEDKGWYGWLINHYLIVMVKAWYDWIINHYLTAMVKACIKWFVKEVSNCLAAVVKACFRWVVRQVSNNFIVVEVTRWYKWFTRETRTNYLLHYAAICVVGIAFIVKLFECCLVFIRGLFNQSSEKKALEDQRQKLEKREQELEKKFKLVNDGHSGHVQAQQTPTCDFNQAQLEIASLTLEKASLIQQKERVTREKESLSSSLVESEKKNKELVSSITTVSGENSRLEEENQALTESISLYAKDLAHRDEEASDLSKSYSQNVHKLEKKIEELEKKSAAQITELSIATKGRNQALKEAQKYKEAHREEKSKVPDFESRIATTGTLNGSELVPRTDLERVKSELDKLTEKHDKACKIHKKVNEDYQALRDVSNKDEFAVQKQIQSYRKSQGMADSSISKLEKENTNLRVNLEKSQEEVANLKRASRNLEKLCGAATDQLRDIKANLADKKQFDDLKTISKKQAEDLVKLQKDLDDVNGLREKDAAELDSLKVRSSKQAENNVEIQKRLDHADDLLKQNATELSQLRKSHEETQTELSELHNSHRKTQNELSGLQERHANLQVSCKEIEAELTQSQDELKGAEIEAEMAVVERDEAEKKLELAQREIEAYKQSGYPQQTLVDDPENQVQQASASHIRDQSGTPERHPEDDRMTTYMGMIVPKGPKNDNQTARSGTSATPAKGLGGSKWATPTEQEAVSSRTVSASDPTPDKPSGTPTVSSTTVNELNQSKWANAEADNDGKPVSNRGRRGGRKVQHKRQVAAEWRARNAAQEAHAHQLRSEVEQGNGSSEGSASQPNDGEGATGHDHDDQERVLRPGAWRGAGNCNNGQDRVPRPGGWEAGPAQGRRRQA